MLNGGEGGGGGGERSFVKLCLFFLVVKDVALSLQKLCKPLNFASWNKKNQVTFPFATHWCFFLAFFGNL